MRFRSRVHIAIVLGAVMFAMAVVRSQQPTAAEIGAKTSGIIRVLASPGDLAAPRLPGPLNDLEKQLRDVGSAVSRGSVLPELKFFVQYERGPEAPTGRVVAPAPGIVGQLTANDDVKAIELLRPPSMQPEDMRPFNRNARLTHRVNEFNAAYPLFEGKGIVAVVVDAGGVRATHREFLSGPGGGSRVSVITKRPTSTHSTHVAGTIIAAGIDSRAKGMAPAGSVISLDFENDLGGLSSLNANSITVTNHSYGPRAGWDRDPSTGAWIWWGDRTLSEDEDATFGRYGARESTFDQFLSDPSRSHWLAFVAAGNDRNDRPATQPVSHFVYTVVEGKLQWQYSQRERPPDGRQNGLDTVSGLCVSKNVICVGAIEDSPNAASFATTDFSAWGPADDGRVKPDLVANGQNLLSTSDADDAAYLEMPGTSMASPTAAGIGMLIAQAFESKRGRRATAVDLKAVLVHSATDAGRPGPDAEFGWGVINALQAGNVAAKPNDHLIESDTVSIAAAKNWTLKGSNVPIRITLVWNDPPGRANSGGVDDRTPALQNDLDIELISPNGTRYFPYRLDLNSPLTNARVDGANRVDNVEVVDAPGTAGDWQLRIKAQRLSQGAEQRFTVVTSGLQR